MASVTVSPYINTELYTAVALMPHQMDSELYIHLKNNLRKNVVAKCNKYGYVIRIYEILEYNMGEIVPENFTASAIFDIKYSGRLCSPVKNTQIICKISQLSKALIRAGNGPITAFIVPSDYNPTNFTQDNNGNLLYNLASKTTKVKTDKESKKKKSKDKEDEDKEDKKEENVLTEFKEKIKVDDYIKINIIASKMYDTEIHIMGTIESMANEADIKMFESDLHENGKGNRFIDAYKVNSKIYASSVASDNDEEAEDLEKE